MNLSDLVNHATDKERFHTIKQYIDFCTRYLEFVDTGLQARIVSPTIYWCRTGWTDCREIESSQKTNFFTTASLILRCLRGGNSFTIPGSEKI